MRKLLLMVAVVGFVAGPAMAGIVEVSAVELGGASGGPRDCPDCEPVYDNMDYSSAWSTISGYDDYQIADTPSCPDWPAGQFEICEMSFVGGVNTLGDQLNLSWFLPDATPVIGFNWTPSQAGVFIWTLTFADPPCPSGVFVPDDGLFQISSTADPGVLFTWYGESTSAELGTEDITLYGPNAETSWTFTFSGCVPEPATLALLSFGAFVLIRRRR